MMLSAGIKLSLRFFAVILFAGLSSVSLSAQHDTVFIRHSDDRVSGGLTYVTDTVLFPSAVARHILTGTCILPWTHNQQNAKGYGLYFEKVSKSECRGDRYTKEAEKDKINQIIRTDTGLIVDISIYDNCCYDFLCDVSVDTAGVLNLIYHGYGSYCACNCCFGLTFQFSIIQHPDYGKIKAVMLRDDRSSLKNIE